jgi:sialidase-1
MHDLPVLFFGLIVGLGSILSATAAENPFEGETSAFLKDSPFVIQQIFEGDRFPNITVATDGTVLAFFNGVRVRRSEDGGKTWGDEIRVGKGFMGGGVTVNEKNGDVFAFVESQHPPAELQVFRSQDHGKHWAAVEYEILGDSHGHVPSMHMNEHGITLRHGEHVGRLIRPSRWYAGKNDRTLWPEHYTNAIYSDDGGKTWKASGPFPANGTGEATVAELSDGTLYYNTRRHWAPEGENPLRRWTAMSQDGGATWEQLEICETLPDGPQDTNYGCMGGLVRLPIRDKDILVYSNCDSPSGRRNGTVWVSFDGGQTWPLKRVVDTGAFGYSSITAGRPGTPSEGQIYLLYESGGAKLAQFNLAWLLQGESTGNGVVPDEFQP